MGKIDNPFSRATTCLKPENLKNKPEECLLDQIIKCHGDLKHPCNTTKSFKRTLIEECRVRFLFICNEKKVELNTGIKIYSLSADEAIGKNASGDFVIKKGKETVIEAEFMGAKGQAFTDTPSSYTGSLCQIMNLSLDNSKNRALFISSLNAVLRHLLLAQGTIHCKDEFPALCGSEIAKKISKKEGKVKILLIGLQPSILKALVGEYGEDNIKVLDLNIDNIGTTKFGVKVDDGEKDLLKLVSWCDVALVTGSTIVNGTIDQILNKFDKSSKKCIFFGNTISGAAMLMGLKHICPFGL